MIIIIIIVIRFSLVSELLQVQELPLLAVLVLEEQTQESPFQYL